MISRRAVMNGTALGSALMTMGDTAEAEPAAAADVSDRVMENMVKALADVRDEIRRQTAFWELAPVRDPLRTFLRANGKFPDFLEVGTDIWQQVYDWHVRFQQPLTLGRSPDGRYTIALMATTVIMRTDVQPNYVGLPYDRS